MPLTQAHKYCSLLCAFLKRYFYRTPWVSPKMRMLMDTTQSHFPNVPLTCHCISPTAAFARNGSKSPFVCSRFSLGETSTYKASIKSRQTCTWLKQVADNQESFALANVAMRCHPSRCIIVVLQYRVNLSVHTCRCTHTGRAAMQRPPIPTPCNRHISR